MKKILIISPHADDETLGAGGYLLKHRDLKDEIYWINVTNANIKYGYTKQEQENWEIWGKRVSDRYGVKKYIDLKLEPAGLDKINKSTLIQIFSDLIKEIKPNIILYYCRFKMMYILIIELFLRQRMLVLKYFVTHI